MRRRGPDGQGIYAEKIMRCSIPGWPSWTWRGAHSPWRSNGPGNGTFWCTTGNCIIRRSCGVKLEGLGHEFRTHSDTEVVSTAAQSRGTAAWTGSTAFSPSPPLDGRAEKLLAQDRMGVKPLFFQQKGRGLLFASRSKTILARPSVQPVLTASVTPRQFGIRSTVGFSKEFGSKAAYHSPTPLYRAELSCILKYSSHITFNSLSRFGRFFIRWQGLSGACVMRHPKSIPNYSEVEVELYNPVAPGPRFGVTADLLPEQLPERY